MPFLEYAGQSSAELIAHHNTHRIDSILSALEWAIQAKREKKLGKLSFEERILLSVMALDREVNNGGFDQFFVNSSRRYAPAVVRDLEAIGARKVAKLAAQAIASRKDQEALEKLDQKYYQVGHEIEIEQRLWKFVLRNKRAINVPAIRARRKPAPSALPEAEHIVQHSATEGLEDQCRRVFTLAMNAKPAEAMLLAKDLVGAHPRNSECWKALSFVLKKTGDEHGALTAIDKAISFHPNDPDLFTGACRSAASEKNWAACLNYADQGRRLEIDRRIRGMMIDQFSLWGARALFELDRHEEALEWLASLPLVDFMIGSKTDPLLHPRRLVKACREALRKGR